MSKEHKEEKWVKDLCNEIRKKEKFSKAFGGSLIIEDNVSLAHSIDLNSVVSSNIDNKKDNERLLINYNEIKNIDIDKNIVDCWNVDIFIGEKDNNHIIPRLVIETKYRNINTHDPITYSYKAFMHKNLFKGLRYGLIVGDYGFERKEENIYIPTRVIEYGDNFDFIFLLKEDYNDDEISYLIDIIIKNVEISKNLEKLNKDKENKYQCIMKNIEFNPNFKALDNGDKHD